MGTRVLVVSLAVCLAACGVLPAAGRGDVEAAPQAAAVSTTSVGVCSKDLPLTKWELRFDKSLSISPPQLKIWGNQALALISCLRFGDSVRVVEITANSRHAATLFNDALPWVKQGDPIERVLRARAEAIRIKDALRALINKLVLEKGTSLDTDVWGTLDRIDVSSAARTVVIVWSDLLDSVGDINLEKQRLTADQVRSTVNSLTHQFGWTSKKLAGAQVIFVLPVTNLSRNEKPLNDPAVVRQLYTELVESLGGRAEGFGVDLNLSQPTTVAPGR